ncbi:MAG: 16S rRNA methyltransferase [Candidatus Bathyarchaeia archaeon]
MKLLLILAESSLEPIPDEIRDHPAVRKSARRRGKDPSELILDRSLHHFAMRGLPNSEKRGRPDIVHMALLEALGSPLNKEGMLSLHVHTIGDMIIEVNPSVRLPRNYNRFLGLMEQLFAKGSIVSPSGEELLRIRPGRMRDLLEALNPSTTLAFTRAGPPRTMKDCIRELMARDRPAAIIGGFPRGGFSEETLGLADAMARIDRESLDASIVASRLICGFEEALGLPEKRIRDPDQT